jgi:AmmeMemoRadiSam system protein B
LAYRLIEAQGVVQVQRRRAVVAGSFYPAEKSVLLKTVRGLIVPDASRVKARAVVSPHAGYVYSGAVAGAVFSSVDIPEDVIILGAPHADFRPRFSVLKEGLWESPLGDVPVSSKLAALLIESCPLAEAADNLHEDEHSIEVQVPFLQYLQAKLALVPVHVNFRSSFDDLRSLAGGLVTAIRTYGRPVLIVASTDMSHYIDQESARRLDFLAIDRILALDGQGLFDTVRRNRISMCGFQPTTAAVLAAKELGAASAELVMYRTSGDVTGDRSQVVGYAGLRLY